MKKKLTWNQKKILKIKIDEIVKTKSRMLLEKRNQNGIHFEIFFLSFSLSRIVKTQSQVL
jgi:hypothetical protein